MTGILDEVYENWWSTQLGSIHQRKKKRKEKKKDKIDKKKKKKTHESTKQ